MYMFKVAALVAIAILGVEGAPFDGK